MSLRESGRRVRELSRSFFHDSVFCPAQGLCSYESLIADVAEATFHHTVTSRRRDAVRRGPRVVLSPSLDIDLKRQSFPLCVVWCPIPVITHLFPPIGHLGVCFSDGEIVDFLGPRFVHRGTPGFGKVARYWRLDPKRWLANGEEAGTPESASAGVSSSAKDGANDPSRLFDRGVAAHDAAVARASNFFSAHEPYDLLGNNCHQFVAHCLNLGAYGGKQDWNMVHLAVLVLLKGQWVHKWACVKTWGVSCGSSRRAITKSLANAFGVRVDLSPPPPRVVAYYSFVLAQPRRKVFATPVKSVREAREMDGGRT